MLITFFSLIDFLYLTSKKKMSFRVILHTEFLSGSVFFHCSRAFPDLSMSKPLNPFFSLESRLLILSIIDIVGLLILLGGAILQITV